LLPNCILFTIFTILKTKFMADYNRNKRGSSRTSNQDWNDNRGGRNRRWDDDRNYGSSENRGYGNSGNFNQGDMGWQSRYEREDYNQGDSYGSGGYGGYNSGDMNTGNYGNERNSGSSNYRFGSSGSDWGSGSSNRGSRNLYDRDYEGMNRSSYSESGTRMGGANYGNYGDSGRFNEGRFQSRGYDRDRNQGGNEDRNWWDRATDEVQSWFGDDDAERRRDRDKQTSGQYKGKGPKNYKRSDERIKDDINDRLSDDPFIDASEIDVTVSSGEVTLTGTVDHRSTKRRAEDLAEAVSGVKNVENRIRVGSQVSDYRNPENQSQSTGSQTTGSQTTTGDTSAVPGSERERTRSKSYV
jgi:osmotically-inducible protein OsmY